MKRNPVRIVAAGLAAAASLAGLVGCVRQGGHDDPHAHHHHGAGPSTTQFTVWSDRYEIFAEHRLVVAGTPTKVITHITDLETLEPRRTGLVRIRMALGSEPPVEHTENAPVRAGIYEPTLTFPTAGEWSLSVLIPSEGASDEVVLPPVRVFASVHDAEHADVPEPPDGITFLKEQQWKVLTQTAPVSKRRLVQQLRLPATVAARPGSQAAVTPPIAGRLLPPPGRSLPVVGERVEEGQTLALLQPVFSEVGIRLVEAESEVARARFALEHAEQTLKRTQKLAELNAKSERELAEAEFAFKSAQARHAAALAVQDTYRQANLALAGTNAPGTNRPVIELQSPIAGTLVSQLGVAVGEYVLADKAVFTVLDAATVFIEARVPEASAQRLSQSKAASYALPGEASSLFPITGAGHGRLVFLSPQVDVASRTVALVYEVKNDGGHLRVGQAVNLFVETGHAEEALALPESALVEEGGRPVAFVQVAGETFQKRHLTLGLRDGNWVQVLRGISEGERVVTQGAYDVRLASVSRAIPTHGHAH